MHQCKSILNICLSLQGYDQRPENKRVVTHLDTWVERATLRVKCVAQENNGMFAALVHTQTTQSTQFRHELTNLEATTALTRSVLIYI